MRYYLWVLSLLWAIGMKAQNTDARLGQVVEPGMEPEVMTVPIDPWSETFEDVSEEEGYAPSYGVLSSGNFYIDLQIRGRGEYRNGQGTLRESYQRPAWFVGDRERLSLGFNRGMLSAKVDGQHTGVWGDQGLEGSKANFGLNEAWARLDIQHGWFLQVGRQVISYDDERIFGAEDWSTAGFSHDAARIGYEKGMHKVHAVVGFNQLREKRIGGTYYDGEMAYKSMQFLWYHYGNEQHPFQFSLMGMNQGLEIGVKQDVVEKPRTGYMQMLGGWFQYKKDGLLGKAEGYYQLGHDQDQRAMSAFLAALRLGYEERQWGATLGCDYVSGSKSSLRRGTNKCFNLLYGSTHDFYGAMDYFVSGTMLSCGLIDALASVYAKPMKKLLVNVDYHNFMTGVKRTHVDRHLGHEIDFRLRYDLLADVTIEAGYSTMLPGLSLAYFKGGNHKSWQDWGWLSINFSPRLFSAKAR